MAAINPWKSARACLSVGGNWIAFPYFNFAAHNIDNEMKSGVYSLVLGIQFSAQKRNKTISVDLAARQNRRPHGYEKQSFREVYSWLFGFCNSGPWGPEFKSLHPDTVNTAWKFFKPCSQNRRENPTPAKKWTHGQSVI
jgi:hypothetical protein